MGNRNTTNRNQRVYSQAEYEHYFFAQEPFSGYVEGIGYTCTEIMVTAQPINNSCTEFMFDIQYAGFTFDTGGSLFPDESQSPPNNETPDRSDYWQIPNMDKFAYSSDGWEQILNPMAFVDNVAIEVINGLANLANSLMASSQVLYHEGANASWDYEWGGFKNQMGAIGDGAANAYNYHTQTPVRRQWEDTFKSLKSLESWEKNVAFGATLFVGSGLASMTSRGMGMLSKIPAGARAVRPFPNIRGGYGVFGKNGLVVRNYRVNVIYEQPGGVTIFSMDGVMKQGGQFVNRPNRNLFRIDYHIHDPLVTPKPFWHYHYRRTKDGVTKGSTKPRRIFNKDK